MSDTNICRKSEEVSGQPTTASPVTRSTGGDASGASVILAWPTGLIAYNDKGAKQSLSVRVLIEQHLVTAQTVETLDVSAQKAEAFYRQYRWSFSSRGRWQVRLTMLTDEHEDSKIGSLDNVTALAKRICPD